jgi:transposase
LEKGMKSFRRVRLTKPDLDRWFKGRASMRVLIESSTESEWVAQYLELLGHEVIVADPNFEPMYGRKRKKIKTDKRDAEAMFEANRAGVYRLAHRRSAQGREMVRLLATREALVGTRTRWINVCRTQLRAWGYWIPSGSAETFFDRLADLDLTQEVQGHLRPFAAMWAPLNALIESLDKRVEHLSIDDSQVKLLQTMPTIGPMRAAAFVAVIDNPRRFRNAHQVGSYLGLVPSEWSSSDTEAKGRITKAGDTRVRWLLVEAAWTILCRPMPGCDQLRAWGQAIAARRGKKIAVVALARRIAGILWAMMRDQSAFNPGRLRHLPRVA